MPLTSTEKKTIPLALTQSTFALIGAKKIARKISLKIYDIEYADWKKSQ